LIICIVDRLRLIDLSGSEGQYLQLKHVEKIKIKELNPLSSNSKYDNDDNRIGILSNGDLIIVSMDDELKECKIYLYPFENRPSTNSTLWEYSQIYDIEFPESLKSVNIEHRVYQTKLFLILGCRSMIQWNLSSSTMSFDMQYFFDYEDSPCNVVINKNKTLLALLADDKYVDIFSMETGTRISRYEGYEG